MMARFLNQLERRIGKFAIPNLTLLLVFGNCCVFLYSVVNQAGVSEVILDPELVMQGEVWRLLTYVFVWTIFSGFTTLGAIGLMFFVCGMLLLWLMGSALESTWGTFRFNLYLLIGWFLNSAGAMIGYAIGLEGVPYIDPFYVTILFAFATLYPDYQILVFFILPVKVKWIALISAFFMIIGFIDAVATSDYLLAVLIFVSIGNYLLFFHQEIWNYLKRRPRKLKGYAQQTFGVDRSGEAMHICIVCGRTELTDPDLEFRYAKQGDEVVCYCIDHLPEEYKNQDD